MTVITWDTLSDISGFNVVEALYKEEQRIGSWRYTLKKFQVEVGKAVITITGTPPSIRKIESCSRLSETQLKYKAARLMAEWGFDWIGGLNHVQIT